MSLKKSELYFVIRSFKNYLINTLWASEYYSEKYMRFGKLKIFLIRFFYSFYFIRNLIGHNNKLQNILEKNIFIKDENSKEIIKEIIKKGYYKTSIKSEIIDLINNDFKKNNFKYEFKNSFDEKTNKYIIKEENIKFYGQENIQTFVGKKGTIIFEDTFDFHKGQPPISKSRLMLVLEYGLPPGIGNEGIYEIE